METKKSVDLRRFFRGVKRARWIYLASFVVFITLASVYCIYRMPQYKAEALILIEDESNNMPKLGGAMAMMANSFSIGGFSSSSNNEIQLLSSHDVLMKTAKELGLNRTYVERDGLSKNFLYGNSPVELTAPQALFDSLVKGMKFDIRLKDGKADIKVTRGFPFPTTLAEAKNVTLPYDVKTPDGIITVEKTKFYSANLDTRIKVSLSSYESVVDDFTSFIEFIIPDKLSDGITLTFKAPDRQYAMDVLNTIMAIYNEKRLERKHNVAKSDVEFFNDRISSLYGELKDIEADVADYKQKHNLIAFKAESEQLGKSSVMNEYDIAKAKSELVYYDKVVYSLQNNPDDFISVPVEIPELEQYNELVIANSRLERSAKSDNPALKKNKELLEKMRSSLIENLKHKIEEAKLMLSSMQGLNAKVKSRFTEIPTLEREYLDKERDQKIKNALYIFLVEQRENAMLQYNSTSTLGFVVDEAFCELKPSKVKSLIAIAVCLFMALLLPTFWVVWQMWRKDPVEDPMDLATMHLEENCVVYTGSRNEISHLRMLLTANPAKKVIYIAGKSKDEILSALVGSLQNVGAKVAVFNPAESENFENGYNDILLNSEFIAHVENIATSNDYVIIPVPDADNLKLLTTVTVKEDAELLVVVDPSVTKRSQLHAMLSGQYADSTFVCIDKKMLQN